MAWSVWEKAMQGQRNDSGAPLVRGKVRLKPSTGAESRPQCPALSTPSALLPRDHPKDKEKYVNICGEPTVERRCYT